MCCTVFDGQSLDITELYLTVLYLVRKQIFEHTARFLCDTRTDAVTAAHTDNNGIERCVVDKLLACTDAFVSLQLRIQHGFEFFNGFVYVCFILGVHG